MTARITLDRLSLDDWSTDAPEILTYVRAHAADDGSLPESIIERLLVAGIVALGEIARGSQRPGTSAAPPTAPAAPSTPGALVIHPITKAGANLDAVVQRVEDFLIDGALRESRGNRQATARLLDLKRTTLVAKLRRRDSGASDGDW